MSVLRTVPLAVVLTTAVGRKNWIHIGSKQAGPKVAAILSVVETCRRLKLSVRHYLAAVLPALSDRKMNEVQKLTPLATLRLFS